MKTFLTTTIVALLFLVALPHVGCAQDSPPGKFKCNAIENQMIPTASVAVAIEPITSILYVQTPQTARSVNAYVEVNTPAPQAVHFNYLIKCSNEKNFAMAGTGDIRHVLRC